MQIITSPKKEQYEPFVNRVFAQHADLKWDLYRSVANKQNEGTFLFWNSGDVKAFVSAHSSSIHPFCVYIRIAYEEDTEGLERIVEYLKNAFQKPLFFLIDNRFASLMDVLSGSGFQLVRQTDIVHFIADYFSSIENESIYPIADIIDHPKLLASLVLLSKQKYAETHTGNPMAELPIEKWKQFIIDGLLQECSYVAITGEKVVGFSLMYGLSERSYELGWVGVEDNDQMDVLDIMLRKQLQYAKEHGIHFIEKEVDSTCPYSIHICKSLFYDIKETWYSYVSRRFGNDEVRSSSVG
ncbi:MULTISPECIES: hypothetical protein [Sporosarcina]|uniref:GNAT family N-acetyltransferase n=1 Tax=Sporosarcina contaminans TaxID=633403 RepID=A0ABW3TX99_9BACL